MSSTSLILSFVEKYGEDNKQEMMRDLKTLRAQISYEIVKPFNQAIIQAKNKIKKTYENGKKQTNKKAGANLYGGGPFGSRN